MNCANHPDRERSAFCQNCGKPLCTECIRTSGNSIFCEQCVAARAAGTVPPGGYAPGAGYTPGYGAGLGMYPPPPAAANPGLAAMLGFIPGVGAMYNGQYAKGVVHLIVFVLLISLANENGIFGIFIPGWILYMVIEAHHTARARRDGLPLPNPFGLNDLGERLGFGKNWGSHAAPGNGTATGTTAAGAATGTGYTAGPANFANPYNEPVPGPGTTSPPYTYVPPVSSWGAPQEGYAAVPGAAPVPGATPVPPYADPVAESAMRRVPTGAVWLIGLGVIFLIANTGLFELRVRYVGPMVLIAIGVWTFVRRMTATGAGLENDGSPAYTWRLMMAVRASVWLVAIGFVWLLDAFHILTWGHSWPLLLILGGVMLLLRRAGMNTAYGYGYPPYGGPGAPGGPVPPTPPPTSSSTEIVPAGDTHISGEGR